MIPSDIKPHFKQSPQPKHISFTARLPTIALGSYNHFYGQARGYTLDYPDLNAYVWFDAAVLSDPVRINLGEELTGQFVDGEIAFTYLSVSPLEIGATHFLGTEINPSVPLRTFWINNKQEESGLINYGGGSIMLRLNSTAAPEVTQQGPFTPKQALETILTTWKNAGHDWLEWEPIPEIGIRSVNGFFIPQIDAVALFQNADARDKRTMFDVLNEFITPFTNYHIRVDSVGRLQIVAVGNMPDFTGSFKKLFYDTQVLKSDTFTTTAAEIDVTVTATIKFFSYPVANLGPMTNVVYNDGTYTYFDLSGTYTDKGGNTGTVDLNLRCSLDATGAGTIEVYEFKIDGVDVPSDGRKGYTVNYSGKDSTSGEIVLTNDDLTPEESINTLTEEIVNVCRVVSKGYSFNTDYDVLQPACGILETKWYYFGWQLLTPSQTTVCDTGRFDLGKNKITWNEGKTARAELPTLWSVAQNKLIGDPTITIQAQILWWMDKGWDTAGPSYVTTQTATGTVRIDKSGWQLAIDQYFDPGIWGDLNARVYLLANRDADGVFTGFSVALELRMGDLQSVWAFGVRLNADGVAFTENEEQVTAVYGEEITDGIVGSSQQIYGRKLKEIDMGWFPVSYDDALAIAQSVVMNNAEPKREYELEIMPPYTAIKPDDIGRVVKYKDSSTVLWGWKYAEHHSPGTSRSKFKITLRERGRITTEDEASTNYGDAVYNLSAYLD